MAGINQVRAVFMHELSQGRRALGFRAPDFGNVQVILSPDDKTVANLLREKNDGDIHVFSGFVGNSRVREIFRQCGHDGSRIGLLSEGRDWRGGLGFLRRVHALVRECRMIDRVGFVLAIGHMAKEWYLRCGYKPESIFDFCYVVEKGGQIKSDSQHLEEQGQIELLFVGRLIPQKRVDLLLEALSRLRSREWRLRIVGDGEAKIGLMQAAQRLAIDERVLFLGTKANEAVRDELAHADVLILPSHWDGWGAVVNEALMAGSRVVCSDFCGAAELVRNTPYGGVFACDSADALAAQLAAEIARGPVTPEERKEIRAYSAAIQGPAIARYLTEIVEHVSGDRRTRPEAPWKRSPNRSATL